MKKNDVLKIILSLALIGVGTLALLANLEFIHSPWMASKGSLIWLALFGISGLAFLGIYLSSKDNWWAVIPGVTFIGLGLIVGDVFPPVFANIAVAIFMALLGIGFLAAYVVNRSYWGLVIPAGILLSLTIQTIIAEVISDQYNGAILLLGLSVTLLGVYLTLPQKSNNLLSAASICGLLAIINGMGSYFRVSLFLPALLVFVGGYVIWRTYRASKG